LTSKSNVAFAIIRTVIGLRSHNHKPNFSDKSQTHVSISAHCSNFLSVVSWIWKSTLGAGITTTGEITSLSGCSSADFSLRLICLQS
jgi:hypothetical protein